MQDRNLQLVGLYRDCSEDPASVAQLRLLATENILYLNYSRFLPDSIRSLAMAFLSRIPSKGYSMLC